MKVTYLSKHYEGRSGQVIRLRDLEEGETLYIKDYTSLGQLYGDVWWKLIFFRGALRFARRGDGTYYGPYWDYNLFSKEEVDHNPLLLLQEGVIL